MELSSPGTKSKGVSNCSSKRVAVMGRGVVVMGREVVVGKISECWVECGNAE